jgi:RHS repeat-associated protein
VNDGSPPQLVRYQFGNHLGSASLELDETGTVISYEEYNPYGSTSYLAVSENIAAAAKRYRYTGKERDEESGLYYHAVRYYAAWLGRWVSTDPIGIKGGLSLYEYAHNNAVRFSDPHGQAPASTDWEKERRRHTQKSSRDLNRAANEAQKKGATLDPVLERIRAEKNAGTRLKTPVQGHHHFDIDEAKRLDAAGNTVDPKVVGDPKRMTSLLSEVDVANEGSIDGKPLTHHNVAAELDQIEKSKVPDTPAGRAAAAESSKKRLPATVDMTERVKMDWTRTDPKGPAVDPNTGKVIKAEGIPPVQPKAEFTPETSLRGPSLEPGSGVVELDPRPSYGLVVVELMHDLAEKVHATREYESWGKTLASGPGRSLVRLAYETVEGAALTPGVVWSGAKWAAKGIAGAASKAWKNIW